MQDSGKVKKCSFCWKRTKTTREYSCSCCACKHLWDTVSIRIWTLCTVSKHGLRFCRSQQVLTANTKACRNLFWRLWFREAKCRVLPGSNKKKSDDGTKVSLWKQWAGESAAFLRWQPCSNILTRDYYQTLTWKSRCCSVCEVWTRALSLPAS